MRQGPPLDGKTTIKDGSVLVHAAPAGGELLYLTAGLTGIDAGPGASSRRAYRLLWDLLARHNCRVVHERVFGSLAARKDILDARDRVIASSPAADAGVLTYIQGRPCRGEGLAGVAVLAVRDDGSGNGVQPVLDGDGRTIGRAWRLNGGTFLILQNVHGADGNEPAERAAQARRMFDRVDGVLKAWGGAYRDVVRTWVYLSGILAWYDEFNSVRNDEYRRFGIMPDLAGPPTAGPLRLPASTGIGGDNPMAAACAMDLLAVIEPGRCRLEIEQMRNARQRDAFAYGSAFSRGACLRGREAVSVLVSGTAAVDEAGNTACPGDFRRQVLRTFDNVEALLREAGATLADICQANVFLKRGEDLDVYHELAAERGLGDMPAVCMKADICREDLVFEMDGVAVAAPRD